MRKEEKDGTANASRPIEGEQLVFELREFSERNGQREGTRQQNEKKKGEENKNEREKQKERKKEGERQIIRNRIDICHRSNRFGMDFLMGCLNFLDYHRLIYGFISIQASVVPGEAGTSVLREMLQGFNDRFTI
jgi:hypothetical protein